MTIQLAQAFLQPKTNPTSVAFYDIRVRNGAGLFFQQLLARARTGLPLCHTANLQLTSSLWVDDVSCKSSTEDKRICSSYERTG